MFRQANWAAMVAVIITTATGYAASAQSIMFPNRPIFGVVAHTDNNGEKLTEIGVHWVRKGVLWKECEPERGEYDFSSRKPIFKDLFDNGCGVIVILAAEYFNKAYKDEANNKQVIIKAVANFMQAAVRYFSSRFPNKPIIYEIGNEPECFPMGGYWNDPVTYTRMARLAARKMREVDPDCHIAAISMAWVDRDFFQTCLKEGLLSDGTIDIISFHAYHRHNLLPESGLKEDINWMREMIMRHKAPGTQVILIDSERGYALAPFLKPKHWASWRNIVYTEAEQAAYLARHYLTEIAAGLEIGVWYKDMWGESGFSLYSDNKHLRPMGHVYRNLAQVFTLNPKQMSNNKYAAVLVDLPDDNVSDPNGTCPLETYLKTTDEGEELIVAGWNPVEAFEGRILASRHRIGDSYYEAWRAISPEDQVSIAAPIQIRGYSQPPSEVWQVDLLSSNSAQMLTEAPWDFQDGVVTINQVKLTPMPTLYIIRK